MDERRALVMTEDLDLLDALLRLAAAAGCELHRAVDSADARRHWARAPLVLLDPPSAQRCARSRLARRDRVVVAVRGEPPPPVWEQAVAVGAENVVSLPDAEPWLVSALAEATEDRGGSGAVLAVVGGRGGAGASALAAGVAVAAVHDGGRALLVDCDVLGGGLDLVLGAEDVQGLRWPELNVTGGRVSATALHAALPAPRFAAGGGELALLSCDRSERGPTSAAVSAAIEACRRAGETVVCDLPRYPTDAALAALEAADLVVLVVPADVRSCAAAGRVAAVLTEHAGSVQVVVRGPAPGGISADEVAAALGLPLLVSMRPEPGLARSLERGAPPGHGRGPLADACRAVLDELRARVAMGSGSAS